MPDYKQAKTSIKILDDGRIKMSIEHLPLIEIEPKMVAWFYQNLPISTVEFSGQRYSWYHIFHPNEHGEITIKELANDFYNPGVHSITFNSMDRQNNKLASGSYFCKMKAGNYSKTLKLLLLK